MSAVQIPLSKNKIILGIIGSSVFIIAGILFLTGFPENMVPVSPATIKIMGTISILFFGGTFLLGIRKIIDKKMGLIVDEQGITDNSSAISVGLIDWVDITEIKSAQLMSTRFLLIMVKNPEKYIGRAKLYQAKIMRTNSNMYGTPISIASTTLKYNFDDLERLLKNKLNELTK